MSKTIDERVVEMRFDNSHFEKNANQTLSTLEKLKQSLNLTGASKGLENINHAVKNTDLSHLGSAAEKVGSKFSAMEIAGVTAMVNMTNSAINAGKRIVRALAIDPITTGFQEYELKMGSVQTIMASTGESLETVNQYLYELNKYSDQTIYSFSDMTNNIGKFTNAGVKLEDAVAAIKGISNEAAISGANANEASRAMYNFAQALSTGSVKLIDWKSIENANMATVSFKEELLETAVRLGTVVKKGNEYQTTTTNLQGKTSELFTSTKAFNESLAHQWMTSEVLIETLKKYSDETTEIGKKATQAATEVKTFSMMCDTLKEAAQSGWAESWEIIFGDFNEGKALWTSMTNAIGGVIDKMSDARNNFLKGAFWEPWKLAAEHVTEAGISMEKFKKKLMDTAGVTYKAKNYEEGFTKALKKGKITKEVVIKTLKELSGSSKENSKSTEDMTAKLKKFQKIVDQVWYGSYGNGKKRVEALTKAGYDYAEVQGLVNKCVDGYRLKIEDLSSAQLKSIGYTDEEVKAIKELAKEAETTGTSFNQLIEDLSRPSGRELLLETINHLLSEFSKITKAAGDAWSKVFGDDDKSEGLYNFIEALHDLAESFTVTEDQARNFERVFTGAFSALQLTWNIANIGIRTTLRIISAVLELFGTDLLEVAGYVGDLITRFNEWARSNTIIWGYVDNLAKIIYELVDGIYGCIKAFLKLDYVGDAVKTVFDWIAKALGLVDFKSAGNHIEKFANVIKSFFDNLEKNIKDLKFDFDFKSFDDFLDRLKKMVPSVEEIKGALEKLKDKIVGFFKNLGILGDAKETGENIVSGIASGISTSVPKIIGIIKELVSNLIEAFCSLLGINSPSKVFMILGGFIVAGLVYGIKDSASFVGGSIKDLVSHMFDIVGDVIQNGIPFVVDLIKTLASNILGGLKETQIDFGALFVVGSMATVAFFLKKILDLLDKFTKPVVALSDMMKGVTGVLNEFQKNIKAARFKIYAVGMRSIAMSIAILVGALIALTFVDTKKLWPALGALGAIMAAFTGMMFVASKLDPVAFAKMSLMMATMSVSLLIMAGAIKKLASVDLVDALASVAMFSVLILFMTKMFEQLGVMTQGKAAVSITKAGSMLSGMAFSIGLMVLAVKLAASVSPGEVAKGLSLIVGIVAILTIMTKMIKYDKVTRHVGKMLMGMAVAIGVMAISMKILGGLSLEGISKGLIAIAGLAAICVGLMWASKFFKGDDVAKVGLMLIGVAVAIGILAMSIRMIAGLSAGEIYKGMIVIESAFKMFAAFMVMSMFVGKNAGKAGLMLMGMAAAVAIMVVTIRLVNTISTEDIARGMIIIAGFEAMLGAFVYVSKFAGEHADKAGTMLIKMSAAILILVGAIALLSIINPKRVALGSAAIVSLILSFTLMAKVLKDMEFSKGTLGTVIMLTAVIGLLVGAIAILAKMKAESVIASAGSLVILLTGLAVVMRLIQNLKVSPKSVGIVALLGLVLVELAGILWIFKKLDVQPSIQQSAALIILLAGLAGVCYLMTGLGPAAVPAAIGIAAFGVLVAELALVIAALGALYKIPGLNDLINDGGNLMCSIGKAIGNFIGGIGAGIAEGATSALPTIGKNLTGFWNEAKGFVDGVSTIDESVANGTKNLASAILMLTGANLLDTVSKWITGGSSLTEFAGQLTILGKALKDFSTEVQGVDNEAIEGSVKAAEGLVKLADALPNSGGLISLFAGDNQIWKFASQLPILGNSLRKYAMSVMGINDVEGVEASVKIAKGLAQLANELPNMGGMWSKLAGETDIATFGRQLVGLGTSLRKFVENLGTFDESKVTSIKCAADAIKAMSNASQNLDGQASWSKALFGDNGLGAFGEDLPALATNFVTFANNLGNFDENKVDTIKCAINAIKVMANASSDINGQAEWSKALFGDNSLAGFTSQMSSVGKNLSGFANSLGTFDDKKVGTIKCAAEAIKVMAKAGEGIDGQTEWGKKLFGDNGLGNFSAELKTVGTNIKGFADNLGTFSAEKVVTVKAGVSAIKAFSSLANADLANAKTNLSGFGANLPSFGMKLADFCKSLPSEDAVSSAVKKVKQIIKVVNDVAKSKPATLTEFTAKLGKMGTAGVKAFVTAFDNEGSIAKAKKAVSSFVTKAAEGIESKKETYEKKTKSLVNAGVSAVKTEDMYAKYKGVGSYLVDGFCAGISDNTFKAEAKAEAMAKAAKKAAEEALGVESPSKVFYKIGSFTGMGFVNGLSVYADKAYNASTDVANAATNGLNKAIKSAKLSIDNGIDSNPTIRPVLDLSDIDSGVRAMNGMLDMGSTIGISANVGAVSTMMRNSGQNGVNADVVSAINKLGKQLGNIGGDTYNIDGVTYDDGSNITDAVRTLVRAAKVERRV